MKLGHGKCQKCGKQRGVSNRKTRCLCVGDVNAYRPKKKLEKRGMLYLSKIR